MVHLGKVPTSSVLFELGLELEFELLRLLSPTPTPTPIAIARIAMMIAAAMTIDRSGRRRDTDGRESATFHGSFSVGSIASGGDPL